MDVLFGLLGACLGAGLFCAGVRFGARQPQRRRQSAQEDSQEAFRLLQNYSAQQAYGMREEDYHG